MEDLEKKKLEQERAELDRLIGKGVTFEVDDVRFKVEKRFFDLWKKRIPETYKRKFTIKEPTLGTLDRMSREWVEMAIDEEKLKSTEGMRAARALATAHSLRCARVIALAVLGSDYEIAIPGNNGSIRYVEDTKRLGDLTRLFSRRIKPSTLHHLVSIIDTMCNLGDFCNSIRLMSTDRTTTPIRIEEEAAV